MSKSSAPTLPGSGGSYTAAKSNGKLTRKEGTEPAPLIKTSAPAPDAADTGKDA